MSHESRPDLLMFGRTLRLPLVRDAVTAYRQQGMLNVSTPESSWQRPCKGRLTPGPWVRSPGTNFHDTYAPISFRTSVIFTPMFHADYCYLLCNPSHASKALCLYSPTRHLCSLPLLSVLTLLISLCSGLDKGILGY